MFQKLNIIKTIRNEPKHISRIAKELKKPVPSVMRHLDSIKETESRIEGRNKIFSIKDDIDGDILKIMSEYNDLRQALKNHHLKQTIKEIRRASEGKMAILFGSYAKGTYNQKSDFDIFVENKYLKEKLEKISEKIEVSYGNLEKNPILREEIDKNHIIISNPERYYEILRKAKERE